MCLSVCVCARRHSEHRSIMPTELGRKEDVENVFLCACNSCSSIIYHQNGIYSVPRNIYIYIYGYRQPVSSTDTKWLKSMYVNVCVCVRCVYTKQMKQDEHALNGK